MPSRKHPQIRRKLTEPRVQFIASLIHDLPLNQVPTWDGIIALILKESHYVWTRQGLQAHAKIKSAYLTKIDACRAFQKSGKVTKVKLPEHVVLEQKLKRERDEKNEVLKTLEWYDELFIRYIYNAIQHGFTQEQMEAPLIAPDRGQTDRAAKKRGGK